MDGLVGFGWMDGLIGFGWVRMGLVGKPGTGLELDWTGTWILGLMAKTWTLEHGNSWGKRVTF
jgi:hypothetical protein